MWVKINKYKSAMMLNQGLFLISNDLKKKIFVNFFVQCYNYYKWFLQRRVLLWVRSLF